MASIKGDDINRTDSSHTATPLVDPFGRQIRYLRLSVTDRCNLRCFYCIGAPLKHPARNEVLSLEEIELVARAFIELGIDKIRITGGEPLVRRGILHLIERLSEIDALRELVMTTNGVQLSRYARQLKDAGIERLNISLDTLRPQRFQQRTGGGRLERVLEGIEAAQQCGFKRIKLNVLISPQDNDDEITELIAFASHRDMDITFIEEMPLGGANSSSLGSAQGDFLSSQDIRDLLPGDYRLTPTDISTGGPARYFHPSPGSDPTSPLIGFISARSEHFCATCNRVRLTATGQMVPCLGHPQAVDLRKVIRTHPEPINALHSAIRSGIASKPWQHNFDRGEPEQLAYLHPMNTTGG